MPAKEKAKAKVVTSRRNGSEEERKKEAMQAANAASQQLALVVKSDWKALDSPAVGAFSMKAVLSIVSEFRSSIFLLRELIPGSVEVERVVSCFVGKLVAVQLYEPALAMLEEIKPRVIRMYHDSKSALPSKKSNASRATKPPLLTRFRHLIQYPSPAPTDSVLLCLIGSSIGQAFTALAALVSNQPTKDSIEAFATAIGEHGSIMTWTSLLPVDYGDALVARAHRALAVSFTPSNTPPSLLLRLRTWALRFLLCRVNLNSEPFWTEATNYITLHGKSLNNSEGIPRAVDEIMLLFDSIVNDIQERQRPPTFISGAAFGKFCEVALAFAQRGRNRSHVKHIADFIETADSKNGPRESQDVTISAAKLYAQLSHGASLLEDVLNGGAEDNVVDILKQCTDALAASSTTLSDASIEIRAVYSMDRLRRICGKMFEESECRDDLRNALKLLLTAIVQTIEIVCLQPTKAPGKVFTNLTACGVDSLCILAKDDFKPIDAFTHTTPYDYLERAGKLICTYMSSTEAKENPESSILTAKMMRCLSRALWNHGVTLYQNNMHAVAVRYLTPACEWAAQACATIQRAISDNPQAALDLNNEVWETLRAHIPKRWELLGDCYAKIGERKLAYNAMIEALKTQPFEAVYHSAASSTPSQTLSDARHRHLASLVERITYIAVFDLLLGEQASLRQTLSDIGVNTEVLGLIIEWQVASLGESLYKDEAPPVVKRLLQDALEVYNTDFPFRRARVLLMQLELAYRMDGLSLSIADITAEIQHLLSQPGNKGKDVAFTHLQPQYQALTHIWLVFHAHQQSEGNSHTSIIVEHATSASRILRSFFPASTSLIVKSPKASPKAVTAKHGRAATRTSPRKRGTTVRAAPVTPKPRKVAAQTPPKACQKAAWPKATLSSPEGSMVDHHLIITIQMLAQLMGLLGHTSLKIQFLNILQRMTEWSAGLSADDFVCASVDAAIEYARLGKTQRALAIYTHALAAFDNAAATVNVETRVFLLLHYAETVALNGNVQKSSKLYEEARQLAQDIGTQQLKSTAARIRSRVLMLERSAVASGVSSTIQVAQRDPHAAFSGLRQSLRLWNRAYDSLARLSPTFATAGSSASSNNPFDMSSLAAALHPSTEESSREPPLSKKNHCHSAAAGGLQWRIAEGLLRALLDLGRAYFLQGSVRAAEYFLEQAHDLAESLKTPAILSRTLAKQGEIQLHRGQLEEAAASLANAANLLQGIPGIDGADINRLQGHHRQLIKQNQEAKTLYLEAMSMLWELNKALATIDGGGAVPNKSITSPRKSNHTDVLVPGFLAMVLRQQIWLQRNEPRVKTKALIDQLTTLPPSRETKAEELATLAKLALYDAHGQFRADLFLNSLAESTIAIPMGTSSHEVVHSSPGARQILETLSTAEKMFWANLELISSCGQASNVRETAISLALARSFQTSLGRRCSSSARVTAGLLDAAAAITLRREVYGAVEQKFPELAADDLIWPVAHGRPPTSPYTLQFTPSRTSEVAEDQPMSDLKSYWHLIRDRYYSTYELDDRSISISPVDLFPVNWTVVNISISEDKSTIFISRQRPQKEPLIFCVPLERHGRKEEEVGGRFTYADAVKHLEAILGESDQSAKDAKHILPEDRDAKAAWWAKRVSLDKRMRELLENIESCWLGAFKTILSEPVTTQPEAITGLRGRLDKVFKRNLASDKKRASTVKLDDALIECFASLSPKCRDEELEDLVYFVLDLYQFHGVHIALSEIDMDQVTVELRTALEDHASKRGRTIPLEDAHLFLILDKNVQGIPWESIPILRGRSVSRIPSLSFLVDRIDLARLQKRLTGQDVEDGLPQDRAVVNPKKTFYVLNPSGDLTKSEARFGAWAKEMEAPGVGWQGIVGRVPSEQELLNALAKKDLIIYIGHGGAEQYVRSHKIKHLPRCAATMLWGCSSGLMRSMGDFDRVGTPYNYMLAGCPTLVACLWDVTDNDLDKFSRSVFDKLRLDAEHVKTWKPERRNETPVSLVAAVGQSRDMCKLKYLTGAAPVVYGIPFYL